MYSDRKAINKDSNSIGVYVVLNCAHHAEDLRKKNPAANVSCLVVPMPLSTENYFVRASAAKKLVRNRMGGDCFRQGAKNGGDQGPPGDTKRDNHIHHY